jgi:hypothetical protein
MQPIWPLRKYQHCNTAHLRFCQSHRPLRDPSSTDGRHEKQHFSPQGPPALSQVTSSSSAAATLLSFPSSSTDTAASPTLALGTGARTAKEQTQHAAPPRPPRPDNDLRNHLDKHRPASTGAAPALDAAPPRRATDVPPSTPAMPQAPRLSVLRRLALPTPSAAAAAVPAPTPVPRAPKPPTARPPPPTVAPGNPSTRASTRPKKRKQRRIMILKFAHLLYEVLPAHSTTRRHEASSSVASAARPPSPPAFIPASPLHAPPVEPTPAASPAGHSAPAAAAPSFDAGCTRLATPPTPAPAAASPAPRAHLAATLGLADDDDLLPPPDYTSPPPGAGSPAGTPPCGYAHRRSARSPGAPCNPTSSETHLRGEPMASPIGDYDDDTPPPRPLGSEAAPPGSRRKLRARLLPGAAPRPLIQLRRPPRHGP